MFAPGSEIFVVGFGAFLAGICIAALASQLMGRGRVTERAAQTVVPSDAELLNVELNATGRPRLRLRGQRLTVVDEIADPALREAVRQVLLALESAPGEATMPEPAGSPDAHIVPPPASHAPPLASENVAGLEPQLGAGEPMADEGVSGSFLSRLRESFQTPEYVKEPLFVRPSSNTKKNETPKDQSVGVSDMFSSINRILQKRWREQSEVPSLEIVGGVETLQIRFGGRLYQRNEDVPHEGAQKLIRMAIAEWDR